MINSNQPVINPRLTAAMKAMLENNNENTRSEMASELIHSKLLAPVRRETYALTAGPDQRISFKLIKNTEGRYYYLTFTDMSQLYKWNKGAKQDTVQMIFSDYVGLLRDHPDIAGFVVNPYGENITISRELAASLWKQDMEQEGM